MLRPIKRHPTASRVASVEREGCAVAYLFVSTLEIVAPSSTILELTRVCVLSRTSP